MDAIATIGSMEAAKAAAKATKCPRCGGRLFNDDGDTACLNCGARTNITFKDIQYPSPTQYISMRFYGRHSRPYVNGFSEENESGI